MEQVSCMFVDVVECEIKNLPTMLQLEQFTKKSWRIICFMFIKY